MTAAEVSYKEWLDMLEYKPTQLFIHVGRFDITSTTTTDDKAPIATKVICFISSAEMFNKPLWQTVWTQIRLLL